MTLQRRLHRPAVSAVQTRSARPPAAASATLTVSAVSAFQAAHGLLRDGVVGPQTWRALLKATAPVPAPTSGGPYDAYENTVLRVGSTGTAVTVLQQALHLTLVDGDFGPGTRSAVIAFQTAHQLPADGVVTAPVWRALGAAKAGNLTGTRPDRPVRGVREGHAEARRPERHGQGAAEGAGRASSWTGTSGRRPGRRCSPSSASTT